MEIKSKISLDRLYELSGVAKSTIWEIENTKKVPRMDTAGKRSEALGHDLSTFVKDYDFVPESLFDMSKLKDILECLKKVD